MPISREPQNVDPRNWYYEYPTHILFVHEVLDDAGLYLKTDQFKIPWKILEQSRKRKPKKRR